MSTNLFLPGSRSQRWLRAGPLAPDLDGFAAQLAADGYANASALGKLRLIRNLSVWLEGERLGIDALDEQCFDNFLRTRGARSKARGETATGRQLLSHLRREGRIPAGFVGAGSDGPIRRIERLYRHFLINERGLNPATVVNYLGIVHAFLTEQFGKRTVALETLVARDANLFIVRRARHLSRTRAKLVATALRSFLRHLYQRGDIAVDLAGVIQPVMNWRLSGLPKSLAPEKVEGLLRSCNPDTVVGRRDHAILLLLARLGLRAGEVAAMTLDDVDWRKGLVTVSGKSQRPEPLPLPQEVGDALVAYLRNGRPPCPTRRLFVRIQAPHRGFSSAVAVCDIVRRALTRAGIDTAFKGAHLLRHSLACGMLRNGASLEEIGQILRHRHPETTQIYAKLDLDALRTLAPAWPGGAA